YGSEDQFASRQRNAAIRKNPQFSRRKQYLVVKRLGSPICRGGRRICKRTASGPEKRAQTFARGNHRRRSRRTFGRIAEAGRRPRPALEILGRKSVNCLSLWPGRRIRREKRIDGPAFSPKEWFSCLTLQQSRAKQRLEYFG